MAFIELYLISYFPVLLLLCLGGLILYMSKARELKWSVLSEIKNSPGRTAVSGTGFIFPLSLICTAQCLPFIEVKIWMLGLIVIAIMSWIDDFRNLPAIWRLMIHFVCIYLWTYDSFVPQQSWYGLIPMLLIGAGWINAYNFMDGINGMLVFMSLVSLGTLLFLVPGGDLMLLIISQIMACIALAIFNVRSRAAAFAGDVGSITIGFFLGYLMWQLVIFSGQWAYILLFSVYLTDTGFTILVRLWKRENIMQAHRMHLYQILQQRTNLHPLLISGSYAFLQLIINLLVISLVARNVSDFSIIISIAVGLFALYWLIRGYFNKQTLVRNKD